jgi:hypothetical protein
MIEVVTNRCVVGGAFLQTSHRPEPGRGPITAGRAISGEVLRCRTGLLIGKCYEAGRGDSSAFPLTEPSKVLFMN